MATPITWRNVPGNSSSSVDAAVQPYGILNSSLTSGFEQLSKVLDQYKKGEIGAAESALMAQLGQYTTPEQMAQARASGAIAGAINNRWMDAAEATRAIDARLSGLQTQARNAQEYADYTDAVASRPHFEAISNMGALGDVEGINAYLAENGDVRGLGNHAQKVLDSIYSTQSSLANIDMARAQAEQAIMQTGILRQSIEEEEQLNNILRDIHRESEMSRANRGVLNNEAQKLADYFGEYTVFDENGFVDIQASEEKAQQALLDNRLLYSVTSKEMADHNRLAAEFDRAEQERIGQEGKEYKTFDEMSNIDQQNFLITGINPTEPYKPRTIGEWPGTIPELIDPLNPLDEETKNRYNYLLSLAGHGTDTAKNQAIRTRAYESGINPSVVEKALNLSKVSSEDLAPVGRDLADQIDQDAKLLATEDEILKGNQNEILERFSTAVKSNGLLDEDAKGQQKVVNEALKLANKERTITGTDGKEITYFLPEEVLETVLRTMPTDWRYSKAEEFRRALENWEKVNMDRILRGAFTREEILKERNLRRRIEELRNRSSSE